MKKIFSLLLVVAMVASMSIVSFAATENVMKTTVTETAEGIAVTVVISNPNALQAVTAGFQLPAATELTYVGYTTGASFPAMTPTVKDDGRIKFVQSFGSASDYITQSGDVEFVTFTLTRVAGNTKTYTSADFAYGASLYISKITEWSTGAKVELKSSAAADNFVAPVYTDARVDDTAIIANATESFAANTLTFAGKVKAFATAAKYGVNVNGKNFDGAVNGSKVSTDGETFGNTTVSISDWTGDFEIILENVFNENTTATTATAEGYYYVDSETQAFDAVSMAQ